MIVIADSGSTKTDWRILLKTCDISSFKTEGLNPYYTTDSQIEKIVVKAFKNINKDKVQHIYFYGAGCANEEKCNIVKLTLNKVFGNAAIEVESDMLGTARGLFSNCRGIAAILGTGSNTCLYNGKKIIQNIPSLGYILGDEGSGSYLGKKLITAFLRNELPEKVHKNFSNKFNLTYAEILENIYRKPFPNRWLASFTMFLKENINDTNIKKSVKKCFIDFFEHQLCRYKNYSNIPVGFSGSVAFYFSEIIREVADEKKVNIIKLVESPINGLEEYHKRIKNS